MRIIQHHTKYKEIHGVDEVVLMTESEHKKLHIRLRKEGKCNIPSSDLHKISNRAHYRTPSGRKRLNKNMKDYYKTHPQIHFKRGCPQKHQITAPEGCFFFDFEFTVAPYIQLFERIGYNINTKNLSYVSHFHISGGKKLHYFDFEDSSDGLHPKVSHEVLPGKTGEFAPSLESANKMR